MIRISPKERMLAALNGELLDRLPVAPLYLDLFLAEEVRKHAFLEYQHCLGGRPEVPVDPDMEVEIQAQAMINAWQTIQPSPDWMFWMSLLHSRDWLSQCVLRRDGNRLWRIHLPSDLREDLSKYSKNDNVIEDKWDKQIPTSRKEIDNLVPISTTDELISNGSFNAIQRLVEILGNKVFICVGLGSPFWDCYFKIGFQALMEMPIKFPDLFTYLLERQHKALISKSGAYAQVGVDGIFIEECMTSADLISPKFYEKFAYHSTLKFIREIQTLDIVDILYYCGDVIPRLPYIKKLSPSVLAVEESKKGFSIDLADIANSVGKDISLFGNIDSTQIAIWNDKELEAELYKQFIAGKSAKGFVFSTGSPIPLDTPHERVRTFIKKAQGFSLK